MATKGSFVSKESTASSILIQRLASVLPKDASFKIYHLSTPPTKTSSLYSAPPNSRPDRTYCESHFLTVSIRTPFKQDASELVEVLVFAIEILIYSTAYDTTFFVSKADSTGYLHLLNLPKGTSSPIRDISATFLQHLVEQHQRENIRSIVSLFARAQDQYLFPGSIEYSGKHVLDDRGLVRWWCRVLDPLIEQTKTSTNLHKSQWDSVKGFLIVPGQDNYETRSYLPARVKVQPAQSSWTIGHPLRQISRHADDVPPRCLVPHYPDDPKARFLDELDDEIGRGKDDASGQWKSVKNVDQFWEMMAYRQECSAGRLVGFIWIVFTPPAQHSHGELVLGSSQSSILASESQGVNSSFLSVPDTTTINSTPSTSFSTSTLSQQSLCKCNDASPPTEESTQPSKLSTQRKKKKLSGVIIPRQPRIKTENKNYLLERPESTAYYSWRPEGRGQVIVDETDYHRINELLLRLDFADLELTSSSSKRWINEVRSGAGNMGDAWGQLVTGTKVTEIINKTGGAGITTLNVGLLRKKRKSSTEDLQEPTAPPTPQIHSDPGPAQAVSLSTNPSRKTLIIDCGQQITLQDYDKLSFINSIFGVVNSLILLASTAVTATNALVLSTTTTLTSPTAASTIPQRDATTTVSTASTSPVYFLTTNFITVAGVTNAYVTLPAKTVSFAVPTCIQTLTPDNNGYLPPGTCNALYDYYPSSASALAFAAIFGVLTLAHIIQAVFYRNGYSFFMIAASLWGLVAFTLRILSTHNQQDSVLELMSSIFALSISPLINAYHYVLLGHLVNHYFPSRSFLGIRAQFFALPFLAFNAAAFVLEIVGATMMERWNLDGEQRKADRVYIGGLVVQMLVIFVFNSVLVVFWKEMNGLGKRAMTSVGWKGLVGAMSGGSGLVLIQIIFSLVRFSSGDETKNALSSHESYFYILEIIPTVLAIIIMNAIHPGRIMTGEEKMESL
ncbi:hypothetical protein SBOR_3399 [Sclerotinia borealis F-4128]|uniref:histone acetyltransferase n=1 Tax=Sclerotinia borealis (strain F-4128) TaxID=1432307 RepID=W9CK52_SCLBF|nr:hypothetical protein SBOR_3399 [Sclerotinia borealis F-4128]